jgi:hypothetical protein
MVSNNETKPGGMNDKETGKLTGIDCPGDQAADPPEVQAEEKIRIVLEGLRGGRLPGRSLSELRRIAPLVFMVILYLTMNVNDLSMGTTRMEKAASRLQGGGRKSLTKLGTRYQVPNYFFDEKSRGDFINSEYGIVSPI